MFQLPSMEDFSANDLDLSKYTIRYYFDCTSFILAENLPNNESFDPSKVKFESFGGDENGLYRYFKTRYPDRNFFLREIVYGSTLSLEDCPRPDIATYVRNELCPRVIEGYDKAEPYSYDEALKLENEELRLWTLEVLQSKEEKESDKQDL
jgi:hypothetical protein